MQVDRLRTKLEESRARNEELARELKFSEETMEKFKECVPSPGSSFGLRGSPVPDESSPRPRSELCNELADGSVTKKNIRKG